MDRWLARFWPLAILFHLAANGFHLAAMDAVGVVQVGLVVLAGIQIIRPTAPSAAALAVTYLVVLWMKLPVVGNHEVILGLLSLAVLGAVIGRGRHWTTGAGPPARLMLLVAYGFIAVSKLNRGFFDAAHSCAVLFANETGANLGLGEVDSGLLAALLIVGSATVELAVPVLLMVRRWRSFGVLLAVSFHFVLALDPVSHVWDFSAVLVPLFLLFVPTPVRRSLDATIDRVIGQSWTVPALLLSLAVTVHAVVAFGGVGPVWLVAYPLWLGYGGWVLVQVIAARRSDVREPAPTPPTAAPMTAESKTTESGTVAPAVFVGHGGRRGVLAGGCAALVVLLAVANGAAPYLELRTAAAFNMYSNLRVVDGVSNHYLLGSFRDRGPTDYVAVVASDPDSPLAYYRDAGLLVPRENLDRYLVDHPDENPVVTVGGDPEPARDLGLGQEPADGLASHLSSVLGHKLGFRRAVPGEFAVSGQASGAGADAAQARSRGDCLRRWGPIG